jgi:hypothetical protein
VSMASFDGRYVVYSLMQRPGGFVAFFGFAILDLLEGDTLFLRGRDSQLLGLF